MVSDKDKRKYLRILIELKEEHANIYTQKEIALYLGVSLRKVSSFLNGKIYDFWMLTQYAGLICEKINFELKK